MDPDIRVVPVQADDLASLTSGDDAFEAATGMRVAHGYLAFPEALAFTAERLNLGMDPAWSTHLVIDSTEDELVGMGGFNGPPELGSVELGLSVAPDRQGEGIGVAAVRALVASAAQRGATMVYAFTTAEPGPSPSMLTRCGFSKVAEIPESEDGPLWRWEVRC
ncbi:MAG: GNAT family N-acetyltransferase [Candidatus Nanopelagicales bacterium]